ncbi:MAG: XrtA system polysaccharide chain length determinant [Pseudomonadota bacterium]
MREQLLEFIKELRGLARYRWIGLTAGAAIAAVACLAILLIPNTYESKSTFYVDSSSRLKEVVTNLGLNAEVDSRIYMVRQAILSRPQLEKVIREHDMDLEIDSPWQFDGLIEDLQSRISIRQGRGKEGANLYTITYLDEKPERATSVVSMLLDSFVEDVLSIKQLDTGRTQEFLQEQLAYYRNLLSATEFKLERFKREHPEFAVNGRNSFFEQLQRARDGRDSLQREVEIESRKVEEIRRQLTGLLPYGGASDAEAARSLLPETQRKVALMQSLDELLLQFTEQHPDVIALKEQIERIEQREKAQLTSLRAGQDGVADASNPLYVEVQLQLSAANVTLAEKQELLRVAEIKASKLESVVDTQPALEREFIQLKRDYDEYEKFYDQVLNESERERIGRVGEQQDSVLFNVIEPPVTASTPVAPKRQLLIAAAFGIGLALAMALMFLLRMLDSTIMDLADMTAIANLPVVGDVSYQGHETHIAMRALPVGLFLLAYMFLASTLIMNAQSFSNDLRSFAGL